MKERTIRRLTNIMLPLLVILAMTAFLFAQIAKFEAYAIDGEDEAIAVEEVQEEETVEPTIPLDEPEVLLDDFIEIITEEYAKEIDTVSFEAKDGIVPSRLRGARLTGAEKKAYDLLKENIEAIAKGENEGGSTVVDITFGEIYSAEVLAARYSANDLKVGQIVAEGDITDEAVDAVSEKYSLDTEKVINALLYDCPYTLFWYDKTVGLSAAQFSYVGADHNGVEYKAYCAPNSYFRFYFAVSMDYCPNSYYVHSFDGKNAPIQTDTQKIKTLTTAVNNAMSVVSAASGKGTYDKLDYYRNWICQEVTYDAAAADKTNNTPYGDPWQLISAFDNNPSTNIVCEGYSKAFKYLCDLTENLDADCRIVTGEMGGGTGAGGHMWNVVEVGGKNYLVDVTNCDAGTIGAPRALFMVGTNETSQGSGAYSFQINDRGILFTYDEETKDTFDPNELLLATTNYAPCKHEWGETQVTKEASCEEAGSKKKTCTKCDETVIEKIPALDHKWDAGKVTKPPTIKDEGEKTFTCTTCKTTRKESIAKLESVKAPAGKTLTYNGKSQTGVVAGTGYTLTGTKAATNAGSYKATATLSAGYIWSDGTSKAKTIAWKINKVAVNKATVTGIANKTYTGKSLAQSPKVVVGGRTLKSGTDYKLSYKNNLKVGKATVTITGYGNYNGSISKTFNIIPKGASLKSLSALKGGMTVYWNKQTAKMSTARITGYQIQTATDKNFKKNAKAYTVKGYNTASKKITGLKSKTTYYVRVRTYMKVGTTTYYSGWSAVKAIKAK